MHDQRGRFGTGLVCGVILVHGKEQGGYRIPISFAK